MRLEAAPLVSAIKTRSSTCITYVTYINISNHVIQDVIQATRMLPYIGGRTNTTAALRMLRDVIFQPRNGDRVSVRNIAVLIANGESTLFADKVQLTHVYSVL